MLHPWWLDYNDPSCNPASIALLLSSKSFIDFGIAPFMVPLFRALLHVRQPWHWLRQPWLLSLTPSPVSQYAPLQLWLSAARGFGGKGRGGEVEYIGISPGIMYSLPPCLTCLISKEGFLPPPHPHPPPSYVLIHNLLTRLRNTIIYSSYMWIIKLNRMGTYTPNPMEIINWYFEIQN